MMGTGRFEPAGYASDAGLCSSEQSGILVVDDRGNTGHDASDGVAIDSHQTSAEQGPVSGGCADQVQAAA
jgi:hypothetical protein